MLWTRDAEEALENAEDDREIMLHAKKNFHSLLTILIKQTTYDLSKFNRIKYETLVTIHVHQVDIFNDLVSSKYFIGNTFTNSIGLLIEHPHHNVAIMPLC